MNGHAGHKASCQTAWHGARLLKEPPPLPPPPSPQGRCGWGSGRRACLARCAFCAPTAAKGPCRCRPTHWMGWRPAAPAAPAPAVQGALQLQRSGWHLLQWQHHPAVLPAPGGAPAAGAASRLPTATAAEPTRESGCGPGCVIAGPAGVPQEGRRWCQGRQRRLQWQQVSQLACAPVPHPDSVGRQAVGCLGKECVWCMGRQANPGSHFLQQAGQPCSVHLQPWHTTRSPWWLLAV